MKLCLPANLALLPALVVGLSGTAAGQNAYQYNILSVQNTSPGQFPVVTFSVTNPSQSNTPYNLKLDPAFTQTATGASRLFIQIGWDTSDYTNKDSGTNALPGGRGAALPIPINALAPAVVDNGNGTYTATSPLPIPTGAQGTGVAALEGHPAGLDANGQYTVRIPVKSAYRYFVITGAATVPRRQVVDVAKCKNCHGTLTLHGNNRTDEPQVCVICHNPNNTDIPYRQAADGPETPIDFKRMVHAIHGAKMRHTPFIVIGFNHSVNDFSQVDFPGDLRNCLNCHIDRTFELPLGSNVLGTTVQTQSVLGGAIDTDPANDLKITPTASACSACHDDQEVIAHMKRNGASFSALQSEIDAGTVKERCVNCHGPGKREDVRVVHRISKGGKGRDR